jgi:hypothetical protein
VKSLQVIVVRVSIIPIIFLEFIVASMFHVVDFVYGVCLLLCVFL